MDFLFYLLTPFTWLLNFFYGALDNYGLAIICFAVVVKVVLFPFSLKGKRGMIQTNMISGQMQKLQKQYGSTNREKYNEEVQKLYERENVNPMSGCLWTMLPLFVLLPLYAIIRQPLTYMMGLSDVEILQVANAVDWNSVAVNMGWATADTIQKTITTTTEALAAGTGTVVSGFVDSGYNQLYLASLITDSNFNAVSTALAVPATSSL